MKTIQRHFSYKRYADSIIEKCNRLTSPALQIKVNCEVVLIRRGTSWKKDGEKFITIPAWAVLMGFEFFTYYIIHEYNHLFTGCHEHNEAFKISEKKLLKNLINCTIEYKKAYPKNLINCKTGKIVYNSDNRKVLTMKDIKG